MNKLGWALILFSFAACTQQGGKTQFVTIGTGGVTGVYYPTGGAIAQMMNEKQKEYGIKASAESTAGSVFNVNALVSGDIELGIVQSDRQYQAVKGLKEWGDQGPQKKLRSICSIHSEAITLVASVESGIKTLADLKGKRVNIGNPGSGQRGNALDVLRAANLDPEKDLQMESLKPSEAPSLLQDGRIDAFFYTVGHPSGAITEATSGKRKVRLIELTGMEEVLKKSPYYSETTIPKEVYPQAANEKDIRTIGVKATLLTSSEVKEEVIYAVTKELFEGFDKFKTLHPAFQYLKKEDMLQALTAPLHSGAYRYYQEAGLADLIPEALQPQIN